MDSEEQTPQEEWRGIPDAAGYEASNLGNIRSTVKSGTPKPISLGTHPNGYHYFVAIVDGQRKTYKAHHAVLKAFGQDRPSDAHDVRHIDNDRRNNALRNLKWGTKQDNALDRRAAGSLAGENNPNHKFSDKQVAQIVRLYETGKYTQAQLAQKFGASQPVISKIINSRGNNSIAYGSGKLTSYISRLEAFLSEVSDFPKDIPSDTLDAHISDFENYLVAFDKFVHSLSPKGDFTKEKIEASQSIVRAAVRLTAKLRKENQLASDRTPPEISAALVALNKWARDKFNELLGDVRK